MALIDGDRRTGRTTRMLREAIASAKAGNEVVVLGPSESFAYEHLAYNAMVILEKEGVEFRRSKMELKIRRAGKIVFASIANQSAIRGGRYVVFYDHTVTPPLDAPR
jgi:hypothetical protein